VFCQELASETRMKVMERSSDVILTGDKHELIRQFVPPERVNDRLHDEWQMGRIMMGGESRSEFVKLFIRESQLAQKVDQLLFMFLAIKILAFVANFANREQIS